MKNYINYILHTWYGVALVSFMFGGLFGVVIGSLTWYSVMGIK